jgi:hypothetical protein
MDYNAFGGQDIIVPKSVRPIIEQEETFLGNKKGAKRQFRYGSLHIREYADHYSLHIDKIDPRKDPLGHLLIDAPEYLTSILSAIGAGKQMGYSIYNKRKTDRKSNVSPIQEGVVAGLIAGSLVGISNYLVTNILKNVINRKT